MEFAWLVVSVTVAIFSQFYWKIFSINCHHCWHRSWDPPTLFKWLPVSHHFDGN